MLKHEVRTFIKSTAPRLLVTIAPRTFSRPLSDQAAIDACTRLLKLVNTAIFKNRLKRKEDFLSGFAVLEHTFNGAPHIHAIITNEIPATTLGEAFDRNASRFSVPIEHSTLEARQRFRHHCEKYELPSFYIKQKAAEEFLRKVPIFGKDAQGRGGIDVQEITQTSEDYRRAALLTCHF
jgi:hypothetical protein